MLQARGQCSQSQNSPSGKQEKKKELKGQQQKIWLILAIDYFTSRLDVSPLENMSTGTLPSAIQDIITSTGYSTKRISIDPGSSLVADMGGQDDDLAGDQ